MGPLGHLGIWLERPLCSLLNASLGVPGGLLGHPGGLLDPPGRLLGGSCRLLSSWRHLSAPLEAPWSALGELLEGSWRCLGSSWRVLGVVWRAFGSHLEASWRRWKGSWTLPRASWKRLAAILSIMRKPCIFNVFLRFLRSWAPAGPCFGCQNQYKIGSGS